MEQERHNEIPEVCVKGFWRTLVEMFILFIPCSELSSS